jgi:hypothetical protein
MENHPPIGSTVLFRGHEYEVVGTGCDGRGMGLPCPNGERAVRCYQLEVLRDGSRHRRWSTTQCLPYDQVELKT